MVRRGNGPGYFLSVIGGIPYAYFFRITGADLLTGRKGNPMEGKKFLPTKWIRSHFWQEVRQTDNTAA